MRHFMTGFRNVRASGVAALHRHSMRHVARLLAVASVLAVAPAFAQQSDRSATKPAAKPSENRPQSQAHAESAAIPEWAEKLNLSAQQQGQIKEIVRNYDGSIGVVWNQFSERYMQTICMETCLMAAIEDNLSEPQRMQVRDQRRKTAQHEKAMAATGTKVNQAKITPNEENAKSGEAAEEGIAAAGVTLTDEQETAADKVQEKYRSQLRSMNRDIQGMHTRLVSLEADKLAEIEKVLTKEQLMELRKHRQNAPVAPKLALNKAGPTKAD